MLKQLFALLAHPSREALVQDELLEAEVALLSAQSGLEYAQSMVHYNHARVERLRGLLRADSACQSAQPFHTQ